MKQVTVRRLITNIICYFCIVVMLVLSLWMMLFRGRNQVNFIGEYAVLFVRTDSMEPYIPTGSYILIKRADTSTVTEDDIITFYSRDPAISGFLNTHSVLAIYRDDAGNVSEIATHPYTVTEEDPARVLPDDLVGVYCRRLRVLTAVGEGLRNPLIYFPLILILLTYLLHPWLRSLVKHNQTAESLPSGTLSAEEKERLIREQVERLRQGLDSPAETTSTDVKLQPNDTTSAGGNHEIS